MIKKDYWSIFAIVILIFTFVLTSVVFLFFDAPNANAFNSTNMPKSIGSLTLGDYDTRTDGYVFDGKVLDTICAILTGNSSASYTELKNAVDDSTSTVTGSVTVAAKNNITKSNSMDYQAIKEKNGEAMTVEFGGFKWNLVYLTTDTNANTANGGKAGDLIATLWMSDADIAMGTAQWNEYSSTYSTISYPSDLYSTSKIRVQTLNGGGDSGANYAKLPSGVSTVVENNSSTHPTLTGTQSNRESHRYAAFTMSENTSVGQKSLTRFLANPIQVNYQKTLNAVWSFIGNSNPRLSPNEAWGTGTDGIEGPDTSLIHNASTASNRVGGWAANLVSVRDHTNHYDWAKQDYLWLPAHSETTAGSASFLFQGVWGILVYDSILTSSSGCTWSRTGHSGFAYNAKALDSKGDDVANNNGRTTTSYYVRPALHLNLTKAYECVAREYDAPSLVTVEYNGNEWKIDDTHFSTSELPDWYDPDIMDLAYDDNQNRIDVGEYDVTVTLKDDIADNFGIFKGNDYDSGNGESSTVRKIKLKITPRILTPKTWEWDNASNQPKYTFETNSVFQRDIDAGVEPQFGYTYTNTEDNKVYNTWPTVKGTYRITLRITNSDVCKNYVLATVTPLVQTLKVQVNFDPDTDTVNWYVNNVALTVNSLPYVPNGYNITIGSYLGTGSTLASRGLKLGGIYLQGSSGTAQSLGVKDVKSYTIIAHLVNVSEDYYDFFYDFTYSLTITKAKYDLSGATWVYDHDTCTYSGSPHTVTLSGLERYNGLLEVDRYTGNTASTVGATDYTATVVRFKSNDSNYETPVSTDPNSYLYDDGEGGTFPWTFKWNIQKCVVSTAADKWQREAHTYPSGIAGIKPKLTGCPDGVVTYKFYEVNGANKTEIAFGDIDITFGIEKEYEVEAILTDTQNYELGTEDNPYSFSLGKPMTGVNITVSGSGLTFDGSAKPATVTGSRPLPPDTEFSISYLDENDFPLDGVPMHAGSYKVVVSITGSAADDWYISNDSTVDFIIEKAAIDLSGLAWNYDDNSPFQYHRANGEIASYTVELVGWEEGNAIHDYVKSLLKYDGLYTASTVSGNRPYHATFNFDGLVESDYDFTGAFLPADLQSKALDWRIVQRVIPKPAYSGDNLIFSGEKVDLFELFGIPDDYAEYFTINARYNNAPVTDAGYDYSAFNIGTYQLVCSFLSGINDDDENVCWDDQSITAAVASVTVDPRRITISGWTDRIPPTPKVGDNNDLDFFSVVYTDMNGNVVTRSEITGTFNTTFKAAISSKYGDNVIISIMDGFDDEIEFSTQEDPNNPAVRVAKPTLENDVLPYTSHPVTFVVNGFNNEYMTMQGGLTYTDEGGYQVIIRFRDGVNYCWEDGTRDPVVLAFEVFNDPDNPYVPPVPEKEKGLLDKIKDFFSDLIEKHFPLWQVITMAVAGILTVIFLIKSIQYGKRAKKVRGETKKHKGVTAYAALLPVFASDIVALNLSNKIWSIMAFAMAGLAILMFVIALITRGSWKKALREKEEVASNPNSAQNPQNMQNMQGGAMQNGMVPAGMVQGAMMAGGMAYGGANIEEILRRHDEERRRDEEERRRQDEERHRQEMQALREEQSRRDEAMKIMLANMMGRQQMDNMDFDYASVDDTDLLVQKVIAGLLPVVQQMIPEPTAYLSAPAYEQSESNIEAIADRVAEKLGGQVSSEPSSQNIDEIAQMVADKINIPTAVAYDNSDELKAMTDEVTALRAQVAKLSESQLEMSVLDDDDDDFDFDDEEEWDSILDEDDDDNFVESVIIEADGTVRKVSPNFRMRLKESSDKNREWYAAIKNLFCSQKGVTYRVCKRVEKIRYQGNVIAVIGIAKRSIKLWLALKPYEYDARRYHHRDVSDKPRFVEVPLYVRVGSDRALTRAQELILALFQEQSMEARKRYTDRGIQELIFTLKYNKLLTKKGYKQLLCEVMHVHDCDILSNEVAEKCIETKNVDYIDDSVIETVKLDDIDAKFQDGNRVTLDRLRKVGLVSEECTGYTVTADKRLTKPLIIVANDFTLEAVKMIALTGGRVIKLAQV